MREILVELQERTYPIRIGRNILSSFGEVCKNADLPRKVVIITDSNVARLYRKHVTNALHHSGFHVSSIVIPHGEQQKTLRRANLIITKLLHLGIGKNVTMIALGGGVVGDLTGFVAANFRRGVPFVQCPTSLLAQADSSIGGKVAVNHPLAKNAIGTFYQPRFVFTDVELLRSLGKREIISGLGEILKYGIVGGEEVFTMIERNIPAILKLDMDAIEETMSTCASIKAKLVSEDERETKPDGGRAVLNLGHAVGQAIETLSQYALRHGEAVLIGLRVETVLAKRLGVLSAGDCDRILNYLGKVEFTVPKVQIREKEKLPFNFEKLVRLLSTAQFALPGGVGKVVFQSQIPEAVLRTALEAVLK